MVFTILLAISGLTLSSVAIYYSVQGLTAIFAAAFWPIVVMGTTLEVSKLIAASWLKAKWTQIPKLLKSYMLVAVGVLMLITSMGIFGFLSKAHLDQAVPSGDVAAQVALYDEKISNERDTIANARSLLAQLDKTVNDISAGAAREIKQRDGSVVVENPAERALIVRRQQAQDRANLTKTIEQAQARIVAIQAERAPVASKLRAVEAEVGPIKYIAKLIYGDSIDQSILEKAVTWVIITIIFVFDPLAVLMILAAQMNHQWWKNEQENAKEEPVIKTAADLGMDEPFEDIELTPEERYGPAPSGFEYSGSWPFPLPKEQPKEETVEPVVEPEPVVEEPAVEPETTVAEPEPVVEEPVAVDEPIASAADDQPAADPVDPLVRDILKVAKEPDLDVDDKKKDRIHLQEEQPTDQENQTDLDYVQNSEQTESTLWQRINYRKNQE